MCCDKNSASQTSDTVSSGGKGEADSAAAVLISGTRTSSPRSPPSRPAIGREFAVDGSWSSRDAVRFWARRLPLLASEPAAVIVRNIGGLCFAASCSFRDFINWLFDLARLPPGRKAPCPLIGAVLAVLRIPLAPVDGFERPINVSMLEDKMFFPYEPISVPYLRHRYQHRITAQNTPVHVIRFIDSHGTSNDTRYGATYMAGESVVSTS